MINYNNVYRYKKLNDKKLGSYIKAVCFSDLRNRSYDNELVSVDVLVLVGLTEEQKKREYKFPYILVGVKTINEWLSALSKVFDCKITLCKSTDFDKRKFSIEKEIDVEKLENLHKIKVRVTGTRLKKISALALLTLIRCLYEAPYMSRLDFAEAIKEVKEFKKLDIIERFTIGKAFSYGSENVIHSPFGATPIKIYNIDKLRKRISSGIIDCNSTFMKSDCIVVDSENNKHLNVNVRESDSVNARKRVLDLVNKNKKEYIEKYETIKNSNSWLA